jgi:methyl-accepting chemotaxis protein
MLSARMPFSDALARPRKDVKADFAEHSASFRASLAANKALVGRSSVNTVLGAPDTPLQNYINSAATLVDEVSTAPEKAMAQSAAFNTEFSALATAMEKAGDSIQSLSDDVMRSSDELASFVDAMLESILGATVIAALGLLYISRKTIIAPIKALSNDMQRLAEGQTDVDRRGRGRRTIETSAGNVQPGKRATAFGLWRSRLSTA